MRAQGQGRLTRPSAAPVFIAGAGIGGLTAALALAEKDFQVVLLEKAERLEEVGAGLQLSPNASGVLIRLGLRERLEQPAITAESISINSARAGGELLRLPLGEAAAQTGAPYWVIHRADLQRALLDAVLEKGNIDLRLGTAFEDAHESGDELRITSRRGTSVAEEPTAALVGADGIWSAVRERLFPDWRPRFSGQIAWRGTTSGATLPSAHGVQLWMGSRAHLVAYPVSGGQQTNLVAVTEGTWNQPGWSTPGDPADVAAAFSAPDWPERPRTLIAAIESWRKWALFALPEGCAWSTGRTALLGDAVHAMLPFAAQGAAMAIEDAVVLAECLGRPGKPPDEVAAALSRYGALRRARIRRVQRTARQQGRIYHLTGLPALARDIGIRVLGPERMLARQGWIHDWKG